MTQELLYLIPLFFFIALIYSSAGFGGGSSYLAVLALFPLEFTEIRMLALLCNITVVTGSVWIFYKKGYLKIRKILPLVILSIPFAYLGGRLKIDKNIFFIILGLTLTIASLIMFFSKRNSVIHLPKYSNAAFGGGIGFLSGVVGIGGGIFLSPLLYLTRWAEPKVIAATTASFILVNSISGLIGQTMAVGFHLNLSFALSLIFTVLIGGQIGARFTAGKVNPKMIQWITAFLILFVGVRILIEYLGEV